MKYVLAFDHAQYQKWCHMNDCQNGVTCLHVTGVWQVRRLNLEGMNEIVELPNWQDSKSLEFIHAVENIKTMKHI